MHPSIFVQVRLACLCACEYCIERPILELHIIIVLKFVYGDDAVPNQINYSDIFQEPDDYCVHELQNAIIVNMSSSHVLVTYVHTLYTGVV